MLSLHKRGPERLAYINKTLNAHIALLKLQFIAWFIGQPTINRSAASVIKSNSINWA